MEVTAYLGLGSNVEAGRNLPAAARLLAGTRGLAVLRASPVYRTPPWGYADQPDFLNAVLEVRTALAPLALLDACQGVEAALRRERTVRWGPRTVDVDVLLYGEEAIDTARLVVPHPRLHERAFALVPLCDLAPERVHPVLGRTLADLLAGLSREGVVRSGVTLPASPPR